jgi:hypothetical protein
MEDETTDIEVPYDCRNRRNTKAYGIKRRVCENGAEEDICVCRLGFKALLVTKRIQSLYSCS